MIYLLLQDHLYLFISSKNMLRNTAALNYNVGLENGSDQLIVTLHIYTLSIYPSVHKQLIRTRFRGTHRSLNVYFISYILIYFLFVQNIQIMTVCA